MSATATSAHVPPSFLHDYLKPEFLQCDSEDFPVQLGWTGMSVRCMQCTRRPCAHVNRPLPHVCRHLPGPRQPESYLLWHGWHSFALLNNPLPIINTPPVRDGRTNHGTQAVMGQLACCERSECALGTLRPPLPLTDRVRPVAAARVLLDMTLVVSDQMIWS